MPTKVMNLGDALSRPDHRRFDDWLSHRATGSNCLQACEWLANRRTKHARILREPMTTSSTVSTNAIAKRRWLRAQLEPNAGCKVSISLNRVTRIAHASWSDIGLTASATCTIQRREIVGD